MKRDVNFQLTIAVVLLTLTAALGKETPGLSLSALPARAQQTIKAQLAGGQVEEIEQTTADGNTFYEVQVIKAGTTRSLTVDAQGKLIRAQVALAETPLAVQKVINANLGKNKLGDIDRTSEQGETIYDVDLIGSDGESRGLSVAEDGKWFSLELPLSDAPGPVQKTVRNHLGKGKLEELAKVNDDGDVYFEADISMDGREITLTIGPRGKLLSEEEEVALKDVPQPVQKVIKSSLGLARLGSITRVTEDRTTTYEVEGTRDGKELSFTVAADGKFLAFE
jgi:uncharacterized membrane protein YkoI